MTGRYCYDYPRPAVTVDLAVFNRSEKRTRVLLIRRKHEPFIGSWAFPGGFLEMEERIEDAARRELKEETGVELTVPIAFLGVYGDPGRDPRGRTISVVYVAELQGAAPLAKGSDDAELADWVDVAAAHDLAFDHGVILKAALAWLAQDQNASNR